MVGLQLDWKLCKKEPSLSCSVFAVDVDCDAFNSKEEKTPLKSQAGLLPGLNTGNI